MSRAAVVGVGYFLLSMGVFETIDPNAAGAAWWPGAGLTLGVLCTIPRRAWPPIVAAIFAADLGADLLQHVPAGVGAVWALANCVEPVLGALALQRLAHGPIVGRHVTVRDVLAFFGVAVLVGPPVASLVGTLASVVGLGQPLVPTWPRWLVGDALGIIVVAPAIVLRRDALAALRRPVIAVLLVLAGAVPALLLLIPDDPLRAIPSLAAPVLLAAALVDGPAAAALAVLVMSTTANALTAAGHGPFSAEDVTDELVLLQVFTAVWALTTMLVAAQADTLRHAYERMTRQDRELARDPLTGAGNRVALERALAEVSATTERRATSGVAVLFLDLDDFKAVNDRLGHDAGDAVLRDVAARILHEVRRQDTVARVGGDEFAVICPDVGREEAHELRGRLVRRLAACGPPGLPVSVSVGMSWSAPRPPDVEQLVADADRDMYRAKAGQRAAASGAR